MTPLLAPLMLAAGLALHGCCEPPSPQLTEWEPDLGNFRKKAEWVSENGVWLGNPSWKFHAELEIEDYECLEEHSTQSVCTVWTVHETNCGEHDFGICKCQVISEEGDYCAEWGCHTLEADQQVCWPKDGNNNDDGVQCEYSHFPMTADTYAQLMDRQASGELTTGETWRWWSFTNAWDDNRRLRGESNHAGNASNGTADNQQARALQGFARINWPPAVAFSPATRHLYFQWGDVCIVNGDNVVFARRRCPRWREIETEISHCKCLEGMPRACKRWSCEERDVGLFSILFRMQESIGHLVEGTEEENYTCVVLGEQGCTAWEGDISSVEEVEWTRCECQGSSCHDRGAQWRCDEYELPKRRSWTFPANLGRIVGFAMAEVALLFVFCAVMREGEDAAPIAVCLCCIGGCIILPFLIVTFGAYGFLALGLPFWLLRCCCCAHLLYVSNILG